VLPSNSKPELSEFRPGIGDIIENVGNDDVEDINGGCGREKIGCLPYLIIITTMQKTFANKTEEHFNFLNAVRKADIDTLLRSGNPELLRMVRELNHLWYMACRRMIGSFFIGLHRANKTVIQFLNNQWQANPLGGNDKTDLHLEFPVIRTTIQLTTGKVLRWHWPY